MNLTLKAISGEAVPKALKWAELYRLLNEPEEAESICRDVLAAEPRNQSALKLLGLILSDQFTGRESDAYHEAERTVEMLLDPYERLLYLGIVRERRAKAELAAGHPSYMVTALLNDALRLFEEAEKLCASGNDEALLRWNTCVRLIRSRPELEWSALERR